MKRLIFILAASLLALAGRAQGVEMFSMERSFDVPGMNKHRLYERATAWTVWAWNHYRIRDDYDFDPMGQAIDLVFMNVPAGTDYSNVRITFRVTIVTRDQEYSVRMDRLFITGYKGRRTILSVEHVPETLEGYFPNDRRQSDRLALASFAQEFARARFEELLPSIRESMGKESIRLELVPE